MSQEARDKDRDAAIKVVESACAAGRIIEADRDKRVEQLRMAHTLDEIQMLIQDIQPAAAPPVVPPDPSAVVNYGPPGATPGPANPTLDQFAAMKPMKVSKAVFILPLVVVLVIAAAVIGGIVAIAGSVGDAVTGGSLGGGDPEVISAAGYQDLLDAIKEQTGSTTAFSAVLYPTYAVIELPVDTTSMREEYWYWDGSDLTRNDIKSTSSFERTDLALVDPTVIVDLVDQVQTKVDEPTSWYAIIRAPDDDHAVVWAYASNDYSESEYLGARRNGTITYDSTAN